MMDLSDMMMDLRELVKNSIIRLQIDTKNLFKLVETGFELDWSGLDMFKLVLTGSIKKSHGEIQSLIQEYQKENDFYCLNLWELVLNWIEVDWTCSN